MDNIIKGENRIEEVDNTWNEEKGVNAPKLGEGLIPVTINANGSVTELTTKEQLANWYNYENKEWANAITKDKNGNITGYFVWIPRYEYKITYYTDAEKTNPSNNNIVTQYGSISVKFIPTSKTQKDEEYDHIHPAFENGSATGKNNNFINGEWKKEIPGLWVAKFPAGWQGRTITDNEGTLSGTLSNATNTLVSSDENYTNTSTYPTVAIGKISTETKMTLPVFIPLTYAYNCICIGDAFTLAKQVTKATEASNFYGLNNNIDSHMLKNSEWGAVVYLTHSQYGRNGEEPNINSYYIDGSVYGGITGIYLESTNGGQTNQLKNPWYEETVGMLGSSTGNRTGVYDLNGCMYEMVATYISNGNNRLNAYKGNSNWIITTTNEKGYETLSTEYATVYPYDTSYDKGSSNWLNYKKLQTQHYGYGDAILETSIKGVGRNGWNGDNIDFPWKDVPTMSRGIGTFYKSESGIFAISQSSGDMWVKSRISCSAYSITC